MFLARGHLPVGFNLECEELYVYKNSEVEITDKKLLNETLNKEFESFDK